jgi:two-component system chemotaxis sensor kinase CheA
MGRTGDSDFQKCDEQTDIIYSLNDDSKTEKEVELNAAASIKQKMISVQLNKLDKLLDLVGELVISEAMVIKNPDLACVQDLDNFSKAARQHHKVINEIQDVVMSIRMVPLAGTFQKMNRIVRDMGKKLDKQVMLEIHGEETEVDKNIIEHLSDPLMHLIRNAVDHGIESEADRVAKEKPVTGKITLEARSEGGDVWITIKDDGGGLNKSKILSRAMEHGLIDKPADELSDQEIYAFILLPGFSTNNEVTEYSGRGVGMDVVAQNIEEIGGSIYVDSTMDLGTTVSLKIPLTLAIIDGMGIRVGSSIYTVPITSIRESFKAKKNEAFSDPDGNEMIMVRGECFPILRLHKHFKIQTSVREIHEGIIMMVETDNRCICLLADELLGEQQVVVKALPKYLKRIRGIGGCTLLGDGRSSLILDVAGLAN